MVVSARGAADPYGTVAPYDLNTLGVPQFINTNFIDLSEVNQLTKFRSDAGHDYSDLLEFGAEGVPDPNALYNRKESCRSMKHYFYGPDQRYAHVCAGGWDGYRCKRSQRRQRLQD